MVVRKSPWGDGGTVPWGEIRGASVKRDRGCQPVVASPGIHPSPLAESPQVVQVLGGRCGQPGFPKPWRRLWFASALQRPGKFSVGTLLASLQPGPSIARWTSPQVGRCGRKGSRNSWTRLEDAAQESALADKERGRTRTFRCGEMLQREILRLRITNPTHFRSATDLVRAVAKSLEFLNLPRRPVRRARNSTRQSVRLPAAEIVHPEIRERQCIA